VFNAITQQVPSSAMLDGCLPTRPSLPSDISPPRLPICARQDLRDIYFGLLGPDASSVTYRSPDGHEVTERTAGSDGAYLIVGSPTAQACATMVLDGHAVKVNGHVIHPCGNGATANPRVNAYGVISAVHYRSGRVCRMGPLGWCPPVGVSAIPEQHVTAAQVRSTITVSTSADWHYCSKGKPDTTIPCRGRPPRGYRLTAARPAGHLGRFAIPSTPTGGLTQLRALVTFTSHVTVPNIDSQYEIFYWLKPTPATRSNPVCQHGALDTTGGGTHYDIRAGQRVTIPIYVQEDCPGTIHGVIKFAATTSSISPIAAGAQGKGQATVLHVGNFSYRVP
jgi:hypothetical protein